MVGFVFSSSLVLAAQAQQTRTSVFEINYPTIPGAYTPQQISSRPESERLPLYINYFLRLFFILAIGIAAAMVLFGGVLYLASRGMDKPALLILANARIQQGLLGLLIIVSAYLVLAVINPQLLVFKTMIPTAPGDITVGEPAFNNKVPFVKAPIGCLMDNFLKSLMSTTTASTTCNGNNYTQPNVYKIELPLWEALKLLDCAQTLSEEIVVLLEDCKCGKSIYHVARPFGSDKTTCVGGVDALARIGKCDENCKNCGEGEKVWGGTIYICPTSTLAIKRDELAGIMSKLKGSEFKTNFEQIELIRKTLGTNSAEYLTRELQGYSFQEDFNEQAKKLKEQGYDVAETITSQYPEKCKIDPFTFYAPIKGE